MSPVNLNKSNEVQAYRLDLFRGKTSAVTKEHVLTLLDDQRKSSRY